LISPGRGAKWREGGTSSGPGALPCGWPVASAANRPPAGKCSGPLGAAFSGGARSGQAGAALRPAGRVPRRVDDTLRVAVHPLHRVLGEEVDVGTPDGGEPLGQDVAAYLRRERVEAAGPRRRARWSCSKWARRAGRPPGTSTARRSDPWRRRPCPVSSDARRRRLACSFNAARIHSELGRTPEPSGPRSRQ
jgi:hypothetical protein